MAAAAVKKDLDWLREPSGLLEVSQVNRNVEPARQTLKQNGGILLACSKDATPAAKFIKTKASLCNGNERGGGGIKLLFEVREKFMFVVVIKIFLRTK